METNNENFYQKQYEKLQEEVKKLENEKDKLFEQVTEYRISIAANKAAEKERQKIMTEAKRKILLDYTSIDENERFRKTLKERIAEKLKEEKELSTNEKQT